MKFRNQFIKYMAPANDGTESGSGGSGGSEGQDPGQESDQKTEPKTYTEEEFKTVETEKSELLKESMKRKEKIQGLESTLSQFEGVDVDLYKQLLAEREEAQKQEKEQNEKSLAEQGKWDELLKNKESEYQGIIEQMNTKHAEALEAEGTKYTELEKANQALTSRIEELTVGAAFGNSQLIREDMISAMTPARVRTLYGAHFESNEKGEVIGYDKPQGVEGRAPIVDSQGNAVSFDAALKTILEAQGDLDAMLRNKVNGSGSHTDQGKQSSEGGSEIGSGVNRISHALNKQG